jgi:CAAX prenyl protease-like protein
MTTDSETEPHAGGNSEKRNWLGYVLPMAVFMLVTQAESQFPAYETALYIAKVVAVTGALLAFRRPLADVRPDVRVLPLAFLVGLVVFVEWIVVDPLTPHPAFLASLGKRSAFNPFTAFPDPTQRALFLAVRFYGLAVMVPVMEEVFWRSFLLRWFTDPDFERVTLGTFSGMAFAIVAVCFAAAHPEWLAALLCAIAYGLLLRQTRSLFACVVAHGVTNLALGIYVLTTHAWKYW